MSFLIKNVDTVDVEIADLGITLTPAETYDLSQDRSNTISQSIDLPAAISAGVLSVLDPLDGVTPLPLARALAAVAAINDTHYRIRGGDLNQLEDVSLTTPADSDVMIFSSGEWVNAPAATAASGMSVSLEWKFDDSTATSDPGSKDFRYNSSNPALVTEIYFNDTTDSGVDAGTLIDALTTNDKIYIQQRDESGRASLFQVTGDSVDNGGWWTVPVSVDSTTGTLPADKKKCGILISYIGLHSLIPRVQSVYVGKHGSDANDGTTPELATLTVGAAITAATGMTPGPTNQISIILDDGGTYTENFTIPSNILIKAPNASFVGNVILSDDSEFVFQQISTNTGDAISKTAGIGTAWATGEKVTATSSANCVTNGAVASILIVRIRQLYAENGTCILDQSSGPGHVHMDVEDLYITGTGTGVDRQTNTGIITGRVSHILEKDGGIGNGTAFDVTNGRVTVTVGSIETTTAYTVAGAGTLNILVNDIVNGAVRTQLSGLAEVNVIEADSLRWRNRAANFQARRTEFVAIDSSSNAITMSLPNPASNGDSVTFQDALNSFSTNNLTIDAGAGGLIDDGASGTQTVVIELSGTAGVLIYNETQSRWTFSRIQEEVAFSPDNVIYVTKNGSDTIGDGSFSNPYLTIKKGVTEALVVANATNPTTVKVLDGIYDEVNPINVSGVNSRYVQVQGSESVSTFARPTVNGQPLFVLTSAVATDGPTLSRMTLRGQNNGGTDYSTVVGGDLVNVSGDGIFFLDDITTEEGYVGINAGNGTVTTEQRVRWTSGAATNNNIGVDIDNTNVFLDGDVITFRGNTTAVDNAAGARVEISNYEILGNITTPVGTGVINSGTSTFFANGGSVRGLVLGLSANDTSQANFLSTSFLDNTTDFNQIDGTATVTVQGTISKTKQLIADGTNVSLNYINTDDGDYIIGNADATGDPGKEFRVRDVDGRVAIGDAATNANMADGAVGGGRTLNVIDSNGNMRIWRYITAADQDPALEFIKGTSSTTEGAGRPGGPNPGDPAADVAAGTGTVWWDMFLQEEDYFVIRHRTDGGGNIENEKVRIYPDHSEWLGATDYDDGDNATMLYLQTIASAENYLTITNNVAANGPSLQATGPTDANIDINMIPKGTGTVLVPAGYEANITANSLITKQYYDDNALTSSTPAVQARRTTQLNPIPVTPTWGDFTFDVTDIETDTAVIEHNNTNTQVFDIKEDGLYNITYTITSDDEVTGRVVTDGVAGTTVISGSQHQAGDIADANQVITQNSPSFLADLTAGDELVLQVQAQTTAEFTLAGAIITIEKSSGAKGDKGDPGSGATVEILDEGVSLGTNFDSIDFVGVQVSASVGSPTSQAIVTVPGKQSFHAHNNTTTQTLTTAFVTSIIGTDVRSDTIFSNTNGEVTVNKTGEFLITYDIGADSTGSRSSMECVLQVNGTDVPGTFAYGYHRSAANGEDTASCSALVSITSGDVVRVRIREISGTVVTLAAASRLVIKEID